MKNYGQIQLLADRINSGDLSACAYQPHSDLKDTGRETPHVDLDSFPLIERTPLSDEQIAALTPSDVAVRAGRIHPAADPSHI